MSNNVFKNIKKIRELRNLTREYVSSELNMSASGYGKIERGEIDLTISKLFKISIILEVSIQDLLFFDITNIFNKSATEFKPVGFYKSKLD